jgi:hypothetical protein
MRNSREPDSIRKMRGSGNPLKNYCTHCCFCCFVSVFVGAQLTQHAELQSGECGGHPCVCACALNLTSHAALNYARPGQKRNKFGWALQCVTAVENNSPPLGLRPRHQTMGMHTPQIWLGNRKFNCT